MNDIQLKNLVSTKILTGGRRTSASNEREVYNAIIDNKLNIEDYIPASWGSITGILSSQSDLINYLDSTHEKISRKNIANGYVGLNSSILVDAQYLPSYVDDVIEVANFASLPAIGETGKIYITIDTTNQYRWTGLVYSQLTNSSAVWGNISGIVSNQSDLVSYLNTNYAVTSSNGVTKTGNNIALGGVLTSNTTIGGNAAYELNLGYSGSELTNFNVYSSNSVITSDDGVTTNYSSLGVVGSNATLNSTDSSTGAYSLVRAGLNNAFIGYDDSTSVIASMVFNASGIGFTTNYNYNGILRNTNFTADHTFEFPNQSGTLALTSDLSSYLALSGGTMTNNIVFGVNGKGISSSIGFPTEFIPFNSGQGNVLRSYSIGGGSYANPDNFSKIYQSPGATLISTGGNSINSSILTVQAGSFGVGITDSSGSTSITGSGSSLFLQSSGYNTIGVDQSSIYFQTNGYYSANFSTSLLTSTNRNYLLPDASGTIALTSMLTGGTITSISAGTGMSFSTITSSGSISVDTSKVIYFSGGISGSAISGNYINGAGVWTSFNTSFDTQLATKTTTNLSEGSNLYFTDARVRNTTLSGLSISGSTITSSDTILQAFGKLQNQISGSLNGAIYQGTWNASTNSPALASGVGTKGYYYVVNVAGSTNIDGHTSWNIGDWIIFNGTTWDFVDNTDAVISVNGQIGIVTLTTSNISEGTNLYYTNSRGISSTLTGYTSGTGTITSSDTILTAIQKLNANMGSITSTQIGYGSASNTLKSNSNFVYDEVNNSITLGTSALPNSKIHVDGSVNSYLQNNIQNDSNGVSASSDYVATANTGTDTTNYIDMGINSSNFADAAFTSMGALDGYLYTNGGNLVLGTQTANQIKFITGGTLSANVRGFIDSAGVWNFNTSLLGTATQTLFNTVSTTINFGGAATVMTIGAGTGTITTSNTLVGTQTTQNIYNTVATTGNLLGDATTMTIGAASGTATIRNTTVSLSGGTLTGAATQNVFNITSTTVNAFGAATTMTIGGTPTTAITHNYSTNATATATTKTINFGTGGAAGSTTNINIGSTSGGTITVNNTIVGTATQTLFNTVSTTINAFDAATSFNLSSTNTGAITANMFSGATLNAVNKVINLGTGGVSGSVTNITLGSLTGGALGTITLGGATIKFQNATATTSTFSTAQMLVRASTGNIEAIAASGGGTTNFLRADGTWAAPSGGGSATSSTYFSQTAAVTVQNTAVSTTLVGAGTGSATIPANDMVAGSVARLEASGVISTAVSAPNITIEVFLGGNLILTTFANNVGTITGNKSWNLKASLTTITGGSSGTMQADGFFRFFGISSISSSIWSMTPNAGSGQTITGINFTTTLLCDIKVTWGTASNQNSITQGMFTIERLR